MFNRDQPLVLFVYLIELYVTRFFGLYQICFLNKIFNIPTLKNGALSNDSAKSATYQYLIFILLHIKLSCYLAPLRVSIFPTFIHA